MNWDNVSVTFDGVPFPAGSVSVVEPEPDYGCDLSSLYVSSGTIDLQFSVPIAGYEAFASLFRREPPGASALTLARRIRYGGRKGRRAVRRLLDRGLPVELTTSGATLRGKAAMLDEHEMLVELRGSRRR